MRRAKGIDKLLPALVAKALHAEAKRIFQRSQELVPRATGRLASSGRVSAPEFVGPIVGVDIDYGGEEYGVPYAVKVHETPRAGRTGGVDRQGRPYPPGTWSQTGQWKYLEAARNEHIPTSQERIAGDVLARLKAFSRVTTW